MTPSTRIRLVTAGVAVAAAATVVGVVLATRQDPPQPKAQCKQAPAPLIVPGVGNAQAVPAVRAAFADWPQGTLDDLEALASDYPGDPVVQFNYGIALDCRGYLENAEQALETAKRTGKNTQYQIDADVLLHPQYFQDGYPIFVPVSHDELLIRGSLQQREGHQVTAERLYAEDARLHPDDVEALVAAAVGRFDEDDLNASFSRLGPLTTRFPKSQVAHYYLGLLSVWIGDGKQAIPQFKKALALGPRTALGKQTAVLLQKIAQAGSPSPAR